MSGGSRAVERGASGLHLIFRSRENGKARPGRTTKRPVGPNIGAGEPRAVGVRNRAIFGETPAGSVCIFPPPHFFPRDHDQFQVRPGWEEPVRIAARPCGRPRPPRRLHPLVRRPVRQSPANERIRPRLDGPTRGRARTGESLHPQRQVQAHGRPVHIHQPLACAARDE